MIFENVNITKKVLGLPFEYEDITYDILKLKKRSKAV